MATTKNIKRKTAKKPSVSLIGPGRLGIALAMALKSAGYEIVSLVGRRRQKLRKATQVLDVSSQLLVTKELGKGLVGDLVIVAVPDDQIKTVAEDLARIKVDGHPTVLHTSGALSSQVFASLAANGWHTGSIHPLASISDPVTGAALLRTAFWCIEGDSTATHVGRKLVRDIGGRSFSIDSRDKPLYHAAAVMTSGNVTALFDVALRMLEQCGVDRRMAKQMLLPLLESTVVNLSRFEPDRALTGPFARGDLATVKLHLSALRSADLDDALDLYRLLGRYSLDLNKGKISQDVIEEIRRRLASKH